MRVLFQIHYNTQWGENICLIGQCSELGSWDPQKALSLEYAGNGYWQIEIDLKNDVRTQYKYIVKTHGDNVLWEGGNNRMLNLVKKSKYTVIHDFWHPQTDIDAVFSSKVFTSVLMKPHTLQGFKTKPSKRMLIFTMYAPRIEPGKKLGITGNCKELGNWEKPLVMDNEDYPLWKITLDIEKVRKPVIYKYVIIDSQTGQIDMWEHGPERKILFNLLDYTEICFIQNDEKFRYSTGNWRGAGVAVPVFSLRTADSFGVGEFNDIKKLVDWCNKTGMKMIQVLPINETVATHSWLDSYPYKSISVLALHPMYLNLEKLGKLDDEKLNDEFVLAKEVLNSNYQVDYVEVNRIKSRYFKLIFDQNWPKVQKTKAYKDFFTANSEWLKPYAAFCYLRDRYKTSDFRKWGEWAKYNPLDIEKLVDPKQKHYQHIAVHYFIQFNLDKQLREAVDYAHKHGVALKGDIPIGISPTSIEAWTKPELFNLNAQAGAPPDDFAVLGQNWGFPTYNWDIMARDGFAWWKQRLSMMAKYFDAYRIDHILGFFRIWEIPLHAIHGLQGYFKPALPLKTNEIMDAGIWFDTDRFTKPYIRNHFLHDFFGEYTTEVKKMYLDQTGNDSYSLKPDFNTQRKIYQYFLAGDNDEGLSEKNAVIRDGLMSLLNEILFIRDPYIKGNPAYHPRIALHFTYSYRELDYETKLKLDTLYIDYFYKRHDGFWRDEALAKLPFIINAGNMMVCGEDLGMVPDSVPPVMRQLNMLSLEIQRMPKNPDIEFAHPANAPYLSVCTTSTHDMSTLRGWWEENSDKTIRFFHNILEQNGKPPVYAEPWICEMIIQQHLQSPAMWTIFPIQDLLAIDGDLRWNKTDNERINVPSDEKNKWCYRMILSLEDLIDANDFNEKLDQLITHSNRNRGM